MTDLAQPDEAALLEQMQESLGYRFADPGLLETARTHSSYANDVETAVSNERLEFLGDAVVGLVLADHLFGANPGWSEGDLTRARSRLVDRSGLARVARGLGLGRFLRLGRTELQSGGSEKDSILSDALEAVIGAVYLDAGPEAAQSFINRIFNDEIGPGAASVERDAKTRFQEIVKARYGEFPHYEVASDSGVEGDEYRFTMSAVVEGTVMASGVGRSKQAGEFRAAEAALEKLNEEVQGHE